MSRTSFERWKAGIEADPAYRTELAILEIAEEIDAAMTRSGLTRAELARRLGTSRAYVTKILRGNVNFTLDSLARITHALDGELRLHIAPRGTVTQWIDAVPPGAGGSGEPSEARVGGSRRMPPERAGRYVPLGSTPSDVRESRDPHAESGEDPSRPLAQRRSRSSGDRRS